MDLSILNTVWEFICNYWGWFVAYLCVGLPFYGLCIGNGPQDLKDCLGCIYMPIFVPFMVISIIGWQIIKRYLIFFLGWTGFIKPFTNWVDYHIFHDCSFMNDND